MRITHAETKKLRNREAKKQRHRHRDIPLHSLHSQTSFGAEGSQGVLVVRKVLAVLLAVKLAIDNLLALAVAASVHPHIPKLSIQLSQRNPIGHAHHLEQLHGVLGHVDVLVIRACPVEHRHVLGPDTRVRATGGI